MKKQTNYVLVRQTEDPDAHDYGVHVNGLTSLGHGHIFSQQMLHRRIFPLLFHIWGKVEKRREKACVIDVIGFYNPARQSWEERALGYTVSDLLEKYLCWPQYKRIA